MREKKVDDEIKKIQDSIKKLGTGGGTTDTSGFVSAVEFIHYKEKIEKDLGAYTSLARFLTLKDDVAQNYIKKKDPVLERLRKETMFAIGRSYFSGTDGWINDHIYPQDLYTLEYVKPIKDNSKAIVKAWISVGNNKSGMYRLHKPLTSNPYDIFIDRTLGEFKLDFNGGFLGFGSTSLFNVETTHIFVVYEIKPPKVAEWYDYPISNCMFGAMSVTRKSGEKFNKSKYVGRGISFDPSVGYDMGKQGWARNVIIFGSDNDNSKFLKNRSHDFLVIGKSNTRFVENVDIVPEKDLALNMTKPSKKFVLSLHYNHSDTSHVYVNGILMVDFVAKKFPAKNNLGFNLGNISRDFSGTEEEKTGFHGNIYEFSISHKTIDRSNIIDIHTYLMRKHKVDNDFDEART